MVLMDRVASRWLMAAAAYAAWCTGTVWALLELTRSYPGIVSMKPARGAFELSEAAFGMSASHALSCLFLLAFVLMVIVGGLRRLLDPDRVAIDAVFWVLRSKSLWLTLGIATVLALSGIWITSAWWDETAGVVVILVVIVAILVPFAAWNAGTLQRDALSAWWRPRWPGWQAIVFALGLAALGAVLEASVLLLSQIAETPATLLVLNVFDEVASFLMWLFVAIIWIERATIESGSRAFLGFLRWRQLRALLWQWLLVAVVTGGVLIPALMGAVLRVYVIPQYAELAQLGGTPITWPLRVLVELTSRFGTLALLPGVVVMLLTSLALGRLLVLLGIGGRPEGA